MQPDEVLPLDQIDLSDFDFWLRPWEEREGAFATLRRERPIAFFEEPDVSANTSIPLPQGPGYYALTSHADITHVSRHPEIYCSAKGATSILDMPAEMIEYFNGMISTDNPRHARLRRIVSKAFSPRMIASIEDHIAEVASSVVDRVAPTGGGDFVTAVAARLPLEIICDMMGVPPSRYDDVFRCSNIILSAGDPEYIPEGSDILLKFLEAGQELTVLMGELAEYRLEHPTDDVTSALINTNIDGEALTSVELSSFFILLVVAGNETTRTALSHALLALTEHPDQRARLVSDFAGLAPTAADELVRWASPVIYMRRTLLEDAVLSGTELKEGDKVILFYNSANRDEQVFADPFTLDLGRQPNPHVGFGAPGPHFCLGAHLARREITTMLRELFTRLPDITAVGEPDRLHSNFVNGIKHLECRFTPVPAAR